MPYYLFCKFTNEHLNAILFNSSEYLCIRYKEQSLPPIVLPFHRKVKALEIWELGRHYHWGSCTYHNARYNGAYLFIFVIRDFFLEDGPFFCTALFNSLEKSNAFKG